MNLTRWILIIGALLRVFFAVFTIDLIHPDEHYQTIEPAFRALHGFGVETWEWKEGVRSWTGPFFFMPPLLIHHWITHEVGGPLAIIFCRVWIALFSILALLGFHRLLKQTLKYPSPHQLNLGLLLFALTPDVVVLSASSLTDNLALIYLWSVLPWILSCVHSPKKSTWFWGGLLLGIPILARIQMLFWILGFFLTLVFSRSLRNRIVPFALGTSLIILIQGIIDRVTWGSFLFSMIQNIRKNYFEGISQNFGVAPWFDYFNRIAENLGLVPILIILMTLIGGFIRGGRKLTSSAGLVIIPSCVFILFHMYIEHKETRFLYPIYPAIFFLVSLSQDRMRDFSAENSKWSLKQLAAFLILASGASLLSLIRGIHTSDANLSVPMSEIWKQKDFKQNECVLLVDEIWFWTHGEMILGTPYRLIEKRASELSDNELRDCRYAVVNVGVSLEFEKKSLGQWKKQGPAALGSQLYRKSGSG